jgi:hypothetical protein
MVMVRLTCVLSVDEARAEAANLEGYGRCRARRLAEELAPTGELALGTFGADGREAFLDIAWQEINETRRLTPPEFPRTLRAVATNVHADYGSFGAIFAADWQPDLCPAWFESCARIEAEGFDWAKFPRPWLVPAEGNEKRHSPRTDLYVWEGVHSTAVLALGLLVGSVEWRPVEVIVARRRPPR